MIEIQGDIWKTPCHWICVPTNGIVKANGEAVMGKGVALQTVKKIWNAPMVLGESIKKYGNKVHEIGRFTRENYVPKVDPEKNWNPGIVVVTVFAFPTKHNYKDKSDLKLIEKSCEQMAGLYKGRVSLNALQPENEARPLIPKVLLPAIGCGLGGLAWEDVKPICEKYFIGDDWIICHM